MLAAREGLIRHELEGARSGGSEPQDHGPCADHPMPWFLATETEQALLQYFNLKGSDTLDAIFNLSVCVIGWRQSTVARRWALMRTGTDRHMGYTGIGDSYTEQRICPIDRGRRRGRNRDL